MFDKEYELAQVTPGQTVTIQGECNDYLSPDVTMKECVLVD